MYGASKKQTHVDHGNDCAASCCTCAHARFGAAFDGGRRHLPPLHFFLQSGSCPHTGYKLLVALFDSRRSLNIFSDLSSFGCCEYKYEVPSLTVTDPMNLNNYRDIRKLANLSLVMPAFASEKHADTHRRAGVSCRISTRKRRLLFSALSLSRRRCWGLTIPKWPQQSPTWRGFLANR